MIVGLSYFANIFLIKHILKLTTYKCLKKWLRFGIQCLKVYKYNMSKIIIPEDYQNIIKENFRWSDIPAEGGIY